MYSFFSCFFPSFLLPSFLAPCGLAGSFFTFLVRFRFGTNFFFSPCLGVPRVRSLGDLKVLSLLSWPGACPPPSRTSDGFGLVSGVSAILTSRRRSETYI